MSYDYPCHTIYKTPQNIVFWVNINMQESIDFQKIKIIVVVFLQDEKKDWKIDKKTAIFLDTKLSELFPLFLQNVVCPCAMQTHLLQD